MGYDIVTGKRTKDLSVVDFIDFSGKQPKTIFEMTSGAKPKKKRVKLTPKQRNFIFEHPKMFGRTCSICGHKITKESDLEFDHTKPLKHGGVKQALAHKDCNRMKSTKSLASIQKVMGLKVKQRRKKVKSFKKKKDKSIYIMGHKIRQIDSGRGLL